jgi:hypothetical protein
VGETLRHPALVALSEQGCKLIEKGGSPKMVLQYLSSLVERVS